ncbi:MAG: hypothetical protein R3B09_09030 [Nannocystaceae bacterium]
MTRAYGIGGRVRLAWLFAAAASCTRGDPPSITPEPAEASSGGEDDGLGDRDHDGVRDRDDACPDVPEDLDDFEDEDGCVDRDNDGDGILDAAEYIDGRWTNCDWGEYVVPGKITDCRNLPEDLDGLSDLDGCPDVISCGIEAMVSIPYDRAGRAGDLGAAIAPVAEFVLADPHRVAWVEAYLDKKEGERELAPARALVARIEAEFQARGVDPARISHHAGFRRTRYAGTPSRAEREQYRRIDVGADNPSCECAASCRYAIECR